MKSLMACWLLTCRSHGGEEMRIVVPDDDPGILNMIAKALWATGFEPLVAADAMQVVVFAQQYQASGDPAGYQHATCASLLRKTSTA